MARHFHCTDSDTAVTNMDQSTGYQASQTIKKENEENQSEVWRTGSMDQIEGKDKSNSVSGSFEAEVEIAGEWGQMEGMSSLLGRVVA